MADLETSYQADKGDYWGNLMSNEEFKLRLQMSQVLDKSNRLIYKDRTVVLLSDIIM